MPSRHCAARSSPSALPRAPEGPNVLVPIAIQPPGVGAGAANVCLTA
jgi:hypothetical protein